MIKNTYLIKKDFNKKKKTKQKHSAFIDFNLPNIVPNFIHSQPDPYSILWWNRRKRRKLNPAPDSLSLSFSVHSCRNEQWMQKQNRIESNYHNTIRGWEKNNNIVQQSWMDCEENELDNRVVWAHCIQSSSNGIGLAMVYDCGIHGYRRVVLYVHTT